MKQISEHVIRKLGKRRISKGLKRPKKQRPP